MNFEDFLKEQHAADYMGTDDNMPDDFEDWLGGQSSEDFIKLADLWTKNVIEFAQLKVKQIKGVYSAHDALTKVDELLASLIK